MFDDLLVNLEQYYKYLIFVFFICIGTWELFVPAEPLKYQFIKRWFTNISFLVTNYFVVSLLAPVITLFTSFLTTQLGIGLFNIIQVPLWIIIIITIPVMDLTGYLIHRLFHYSPLLWHCHTVHHTDLDLDLTTGWRFHPIEAVITVLFQSMVIALLGLPPVAVLIHGIFQMFANFFIHSNIRLSKSVDEALRLIIVTPAMHHIHHSPNREENDTNFGAIFSFWDRLFGSYRSKPIDVDKPIIYGLKEFPAFSDTIFLNAFTMPFKKGN